MPRRRIPLRQLADTTGMDFKITVDNKIVNFNVQYLGEDSLNWIYQNDFEGELPDPLYDNSNKVPIRFEITATYENVRRNVPPLYYVSWPFGRLPPAVKQSFGRIAQVIRDRVQYMGSFDEFTGFNGYDEPYFDGVVNNASFYATGQRVRNRMLNNCVGNFELSGFISSAAAVDADIVIVQEN